MNRKLWKVQQMLLLVLMMMMLQFTCSDSSEGTAVIAGRLLCTKY